MLSKPLRVGRYQLSKFTWHGHRQRI